MDALTGDRKEEKAASPLGDHDYSHGKSNTLAVGLAVTPNLFADSIYAQGFNTPMAMEWGPDGRLWVLEKGGAIKIVTSLTTTATFHTLAVDQNTERGLLGIAFDPAWSSGSRYVYVHYSVPGANRNRVSRFTAALNGALPPTLVAGSEVNLFDLSPQTASAYHHGGPLRFGPDGHLYVTTGDNRATELAQSQASLHGKLLRISKVPSGTAGVPTIPTDNPFYASNSGVHRAIWALGLRNPFTFDIQRGTGRTWINDIGQDAYEEINDATVKGLNFGWPAREGGTTNESGFTAPIGGYENGGDVNLDDCAIIGATFYNPPATLPPGAQRFPAEYEGDYFYGDHCSGYIKRVDATAARSPSNFASNVKFLMDLRTGPDGSLYYLTLNGGPDGRGYVGRIYYTASGTPTIARHPVSLTVGTDGDATFTAEANGAPTLAYQWLRNGEIIAGATSATYTRTAVTMTDNNSTYSLRVTNSLGTITSRAAVLTVSTNRAPKATINTPVVGATYQAGSTLSYSGSGTDPEGGAVTYSWKIDLHHDTHTHMAMNPVGGTSGTFTIARSGEISPNVWYRVYLTVSDPQGFKHTVYRDVHPDKVNITVTTSPPGLEVLVDGQPRTAPYTYTGVVGMTRTIGVNSPQPSNNSTYTFQSWSDGGAQNHSFNTPATNTTYTATFTTGGGSNPLPRAGWTATASSSTGGDVPGNALDGNAGTRWSTGVAMASGQWFVVDMKALQTFDRIAFDAGPSTDYPRSYQLSGSNDGTNWGPAFFTGTNNSSSQVSASFAAQTNRYVRILQTTPAGTTGSWWSIHELNVYGTSAPPSPWTQQDIGNVGLTGGTTVSGSTYTVKGAGDDIYNTADGFHFYHRALVGDGSLTARVGSITNTHHWAKAGIMIRETTASGSRHVYVGTTPASGLEFLRREVAGGGTMAVGVTGIGAPRWFRATRVGNVLTVFHSADGSAWTQMGQVTLALAANVRMGLAVTSHNTATLNTAVFDNVTAVE